MKVARRVRNLRRSLAASSVKAAGKRFQSSLSVSVGEGCKPRAQQLRELTQLALARSFSPEEYFTYRFYERGKGYEEMFRFMSQVAMREIFRPAVNDRQWKPILDNKWLFHRHYGPLGVALPQLYGYFDAEHGVSMQGAPLRTADDVLNLLLQLRPAGLVVKPVIGIQGKSVLVLERLSYEDGRVEAVGVDGRARSFEELMAHLTARHGIRYEPHEDYVVEGGGYLLEEKLEQHPFFAEINPFTPNTVRIVTFADCSGEVHLDLAAVRFGRRGSNADNWAQGGISVAVDLETGRLGKGSTKPKSGGDWFDRHPDTEVAFVGRTVPMWQEVLELCRHAARMSPHVRSIGWDVLVTAAGPKMIEGNPDWDLMMVQAHSQGYLQPAVRERFERLGMRFPDRPAPVDARGPLMLLRYSNN